jgi:glutamate synthase (NADPH/NADH) large chain
VVSALALVHQRFSTNTFPEWPLAHPYRMVAHNGEINTVKGNFNWMRAREGVMKSPVLGDDLKKLYPISFEGQSDTATFDNALELLTMSGYPLAHAAMMMIPEAWEQHELMDARRRAFYEYHAAMLEPWDGPAAMVFTDGKQIGATLDRNGLRPARYIVTDDDLVVMASNRRAADPRAQDRQEVAPAARQDVPDRPGAGPHHRRRGTEEPVRLRQALPAVDRERAHPARLHRRQGRRPHRHRKPARPPAGLRLHAGRHQVPAGAHGHRRRRSHRLDGQRQPAGRAVDKNKPLFNYFKQLFAQVTNPPIDPIREAIVMSLNSFIGPKPNLLDINAVNPPMRLEVAQPVLDFDDMARLRAIEQHTNGKFKSYELDITYPLAWGHEGVEAKLASLCAEAVDAIQGGHNILIITDRRMDRDRSPSRRCWRCRPCTTTWCAKASAPPPAWWWKPAVRARCTTSRCWPATAPRRCTPTWRWRRWPRCMPSCRAPVAREGDLQLRQGRRQGPQSKIMSKMGVSTYMSYCGAQLFEAIGLEKSFVQKYFRGTATQVGGIGVFEVAEEALRMHRAAFGNDPVLATMLDAGGEYAWRARGEEHMWTPDAIAKLQHSTRANKFDTYKEYAQLINDQSKRHMTLRGLFEFKIDPTKAIPLDEVESAAEIVKRFATGAMSLGSISTEAHSTLAIAMNRIGGKSNTGEGGEDPARYRNELKGIQITQGTKVSDVIGAKVIEADYELQDGDSLRSKIKQVASGRFGVTTEYLVSADQIQIKMAQGAKPGEGGQLPGGKVSDYIGFLRYSVPGVGLISPPPHHDIYSIEDLAQLIHDLKNANPRASISVKLVSEVGVGTIAAGVAKCKADHLVIAGHDGGTGASPWSSIKHCGTPWELGLAETQQTLVLNRLRSRVRVQADGQMKTGRDVVIGALLGADEFGFATAPLVVEGCIMMRKCHLNTCPVGVATQDPVLRKKFAGKPEHVVNYFFFVAEEARQIMAQLGIRKFDDLIGRSDLLDTRKGIAHWKARGPGLQQGVPPARGAGRCAALPHRGCAGPRPGQGAGRAADREVPARHPARREGAVHAGCAQPQPQRGRHAVGRADPPPARRPARPHHLHADGRHRRPELRGLPGQGHHPVPDRRRERLRRQGPERAAGWWCGPASTSAAMPPRTSSSATQRCTAPPAARPSSAAWRASALRCA